jgi:hypothetical protein
MVVRAGLCSLTAWKLPLPPGSIEPWCRDSLSGSQNPVFPQTLRPSVLQSKSLIARQDFHNVCPLEQSCCSTNVTFAV